MNESLQRFGISEASTRVLLVAVNRSVEEMREMLGKMDPSVLTLDEQLTLAPNLEAIAKVSF